MRRRHIGHYRGTGADHLHGGSLRYCGRRGIKVGTASIYLYGVFFLLQILMLRSKFKWERCFQLLPILAHGVLLNFFRYRFAPFQHLAPQGYLQQMLCFLCGMGLISLGFTITKNCNFTNYPAEAFCALVAERVRMRYGTCKIFLDFAYVIFALLICWRAGLGLGVVREGTVIFALLDGVLINLMTPAVRGCFDRLDHILKT